MHWEWVATNSQRILELTLRHLYQGVVPVAIGALVALPVAYYASRRRDRGSERRIGARTLMHLSSLLYTIPRSRCSCSCRSFWEPPLFPR